MKAFSTRTWEQHRFERHLHRHFQQHWLHFHFQLLLHWPGLQDRLRVLLVLLFVKEEETVCPMPVVLWLEALTEEISWLFALTLWLVYPLSLKVLI